MAELKKVRGTDINYIFQVPYGILYAQYIRGLGEKLARCFAPLSSTVIQSNVSWNIPDGLSGAFHCVENDPNEGLFIMLWEKIQQEVREKMTANGVPNTDIDKLLTFPNYSYLFYHINEDAKDDVPELKYTLVLCGWACRCGIVGNSGADDAEQKTLDAKNMHQQVEVHFMDGNNRAMTNHAFAYTYDNKNCREIKSSSTGIHNLGICKIGCPVVYRDLATDIDQSFIVEQGRRTYVLTFSTKADLSILVVNQKEEPQNGVNLSIKYGEQTDEKQTDSEGKTSLTDILFTKDKKIHITGDYNINEWVELKPYGNTVTIHIQTPDVVEDPPKPESEPEPKPEPKPDSKPISLPVTVRVEYEDGTEVPDYGLTVTYKDQTIHGMTDSQGKFYVNYLEEHTPFHVEDATDPQIYQNYEVEKDVEEYIFKIPKPEPVLSDIIVSLEDKNHKIISQADMTLTNSAGEHFHGITDNVGKIVVPRSFFTDKEKINVRTAIPNMTVHDCKFKYTEECDFYLIRLKDPFPWGCLWRLLLALLLFGLLFIRLNKDITIHTTDVMGQPIPSAAVTLEYTEHQLFKNGTIFYKEQHSRNSITDQTGTVVFTDLPYSVFSFVVYSFSQANAVGYSNNQVTQKSFLFHWKKECTLIFDTNLYITVIDALTLRPISGAKVQATGLSINNKQCELLTDKNGQCQISLQNGSPIDKILTTAAGYSGSLLYNVSYEPQGLIIPLGPPATCNIGVDNGNLDQGNHAIYDFNMGQQGGSFMFDFYTHGAPDHIMIYDGTSADYANGTAPLIFDYDGATHTTSLSEHVTVSFTSQFICVVVDNGTIWGYFVNCPN